MRRWKGLFFGAFLVLPFLVGCSSNNTNDETSYYEEEKSSVPEKVKVVWHNYDNSILQVDNVYTGTMPVYRGETPTREPTTSTEFTFTGWSPEVSGVYENTDYYAMYSSSVRKYTITWLNYDNSVINSQKVEYGETPVYSGSTPKRTSDTNLYTFKGWDPAVLPVTGNATYKATYSSTPIETTKYYEITWKNYDGSVLSKTSVKEGDTPVYDKSTPTRPTANRTEYTFDSWKPTPVPATQNATYTAQYTENYLGCVIYFDLNGGKSSCPLSKTVYSLSSSDFPYDVVKDGYNFRGWSYNGKTVFDESGKTVNSVQLVNGMTFVAIYSTSAKLTLISSVSGETDIVGGTISGAGDYSYHASVTINAYPFEGFSFQGWYDDSGVQISTTPEYNFVMWEKDTKLTAVFALKSYTLTLSSNSSTLGSVKDGTGSYSSSTSVSHKYTKSVTIYALNKTEDYEFLGWFNGEERVSSNAVYTFSMPCKNYSLVAKWDAFTYHVYQNNNYQDKATISFDSNGGSSVSSQAITPSTGLTCPTPTKTNAILRGWSWQKYKDDFYDFNSSLSFDSKLYARWEDNADTSTYVNPLSHVSSSSNTSRSFTTSSTFWFNCLTSGTKTIYIYNSSSNYSFTITVTQNKSGSTSTVIKNQTITYNSGSYTALTFTGVAGAKYTATISKSTSTSTYYYLYFNGFSASSAAKYQYYTGVVSMGGYLDFNITRKGYVLTGFEDENGATYTSSTKWNKYVDNAKLVAVWTANSFSITYNLNGGTLPSSAKTSYSYGTNYTLPTPTLGSLTFDGWYLESDYSGTKITNTDGFLSSITLYAKYIASTNLVTNGIRVELYYSGQTSPFETYSLAPGESFGIPETPVRSGYVFCGWYKDSSCSTTYNFSVAPTTGIVKLYSKWSSSYSATQYKYFSDITNSNVATTVNNSGNTFYYVAKYSGTMTIYYKNSSSSSSYRTYLYIYRASTNSSIVSTSTYSTSYNSTSFTIVAGEVYRMYTSYSSYSATLTYYFSGSGTAPSIKVTSYQFAQINFVYGQNFRIDVPSIDGFDGYYYYDESNSTFTKLTDSSGKSLSPFNFTKPIKIYSSASLSAFIGTANS